MSIVPLSASAIPVPEPASPVVIVMPGWAFW